MLTDSVPRLLSLSRVFAIAKGFRGKAKNCFRVANAQAEEALENQVVARSVSCVPRQSLLLSAGASGLTWWGVWQYADRKILKRDMRALWIQRINAGTREHGLKYGDFIHGQKLANVALDRKVLADLAVTEPSAFKSVVELARDALVAKMSSSRAQAQ